MEAKENWQGDKNLDKTKPTYPATNSQRYAYTRIYRKYRGV